MFHYLGHQNMQYFKKIYFHIFLQISKYRTRILLGALNFFNFFSKYFPIF
jgi:hypothetical protein